MGLAFRTALFSFVLYIKFPENADYKGECVLLLYKSLKIMVMGSVFLSRLVTRSDLFIRQEDAWQLGGNMDGGRWGHCRGEGMESLKPSKQVTLGI